MTKVTSFEFSQESDSLNVFFEKRQKSSLRNAIVYYMGSNNYSKTTNDTTTEIEFD